MDNIISAQIQICKVRPNLFQLTTGHVIGYGPRLAPDGLGFCFTCGGGDCSHVATVDEDWLAGGHSVESETKDKAGRIIPTAWWTVKGIDQFSLDRETGEVSYAD